MRNEILIAFWVTLLAMVVFGCLQEEAPASPIQNPDLSQPETMNETVEVVVEEPADEAPIEEPMADDY